MPKTGQTGHKIRSDRIYQGAQQLKPVRPDLHRQGNFQVPYLLCLGSKLGDPYIRFDRLDEASSWCTQTHDFTSS